MAAAVKTQPPLQEAPAHQGKDLQAGLVAVLSSTGVAAAVAPMALVLQEPHPRVAPGVLAELANWLTRLALA